MLLPAVTWLLLADVEATPRWQVSGAVAGGLRFESNRLGVEVLPVAALSFDGSWRQLRYLRLTALVAGAFLSEPQVGVTGSNFSLALGIEGTLPVRQWLFLAGAFAGGAIAHLNLRCTAFACASDSTWKPAPLVALRLGAEMWLIDRLAVGPMLTLRWMPLGEYIDPIESMADTDVRWLELALRLSISL